MALALLSFAPSNGDQMIRFTLSLAIMLLIAFPRTTFSAPEGPLDSLLDSPNRPTLEDIESALGSIPPRLPFGSSGDARTIEPSNISSFVRGESLLENTKIFLPQIVAQLEKAFPGGTYAVLGRGAGLLADALEAFYFSIGEHDRVVRLKASTTSFTLDGSGNIQAFRIPQDLIVRFLLTSGMPSKIAPDTRPFVMLDITGFRQHSQSTQLMQAAYSYYLAQGTSPQAIAEKISFVSTMKYFDTTERTTHYIDSGFSLERFNEKNFDGSGPVKILTVPGDKFMYEDMTLQRTWHARFGKLVDTGTSVFGSPGAPSNKSVRKQILDTMVALYHLVSQPTFLKRVEEESAKLGFTFNPQSSRAFKPYFSDLYAKGDGNPAEACTRALSAL